MGHARIRGSRGWVTARGHPAQSNHCITRLHVNGSPIYDTSHAEALRLSAPASLLAGNASLLSYAFRTSCFVL